MALTTTIPFEDYKNLVKDSADKENIVNILHTEFPDESSQLLAIKAILGVKEETEEEPSEEPIEEEGVEDESEG